VVESRDTALAYYDAIDPTGARDTVDKWLRDNCFQPELAGRPGYYGSDIQSTYLNDRDLGFGREMYFKTDCSTAQRGATNATLNTNAGERASIVFNYPSLEAAIKRSGSFLAVAMEYRADAGGGPKYTRFYTFAPDPRTRVWKRVTSANFDGRRERYTPGNCTVCHGGKPRASYAGGGELGATFIPWDANALLFADTDPSIVDQRLLPGFSRADQLPFIKALNQQGVQPIIDSRVADTAASGETLARWNAVSDLLAGWYPAAGGTNYNYVPASWQGGTSTGSASLSSSALYSQVFAENCRMCHMQRITEPGVSGLAVATAPQFNAFADVDGSLPIETTRLKERIFEQHVMPASRLTSDRFWIAQAGASQSGAQVLAAHLGLTLPAAKPAVTAVVETPPTDVDPGQASANVRLSALKSRFASSYSWTLQGPAGSNAVLVGANAAEPAFRADVSGTYTLNLTVRDADGNTNTLAPPLSIVADRKPVGGSYTITPNPTSGQAVSLDLFATGGARPGDGSHTAIILSQPTGSGASLPTGCVTSCVLGFTATASGTIRYRLTDADGDQVDGEVFVTVSVPNQWSPRTYHGGVAFDDSVTCASGVNACARVVSGLDPTALARAALNLTVQQYNALNYTASVSFNQLPFRTGRVARPALQTGVTATNTSVTYTSPPLFVSSQDTLGNQMRDSFSYSIVVRDAGNNVVSQSLQDSVQMTVNPRARWSTTLATLQSLTCNSAGCHQAAPDYSIRSWGFAAYQPGTVAYDTYEQLGGIFRTSCPTGEAGATPFCVDYNNPAGSLLLQKPQGQYTHTGGGAAPGQPGALLTAGQLALIEDWIRDGAYRN
jgi:mono/diheme cytochrome c family protein